MTRKEQIKILDNKIESNINHYKINRLNIRNAEMRKCRDVISEMRKYQLFRVVI